MPQSPVFRTFDATTLNLVANDAAVRPWLKGDGPLDLTSLVADPANVALQSDAGGFVLTPLGGGVYEAHSMFNKPRSAYAAMCAGVEYMFVRTDCTRIVTRVPDDNERAHALGNAGGFVESFRTDGVSVRALSAYRWASLNASLENEGKWFHDRCAEIAPGLPDHPADTLHDRAAGAAVRMIRAGNGIKAVSFYNGWAALAGYPPLRLLTLNPLTLDLGAGVVVEVVGGDMERIPCR